MARRLYLGRLPTDVRSEDVSKLFETYGRIVDCRVMTGFGFVEYENAKDAEDAVQQSNGKPFQGSNIVVEFAKETRPRREHFEGAGGGGDRPPRSRRPPGIRLLVTGISRDTSWQDLKDFGRDAGSVSFADIDRDVPGQGVLEYLSREDANRAVRDLDGKDLRGKIVNVQMDESRSGPDNYRRDDRRDDRRDHRDDRYGRDDRYSRRERSRSPIRRDDDRRGHRSPPPRRDTDERRHNGDEDRRRDDRRRDDKDAPARAANGDGGWSL